VRPNRFVWLLIKTDFLMHAARNPDVADRLLHHRSQLRQAIEHRLISTRLKPPEPFTTPGEAAHAVVAAYDGVTVQLLLDHDLTAARGWLHQLLTALLDPSRGHSTDGPSP
jgi:hypothetical protein